MLIGITPSMQRRPDWEWGFTIDPSEFQRQIIADHEESSEGSSRDSSSSLRAER